MSAPALTVAIRRSMIFDPSDEWINVNFQYWCDIKHMHYITFTFHSPWYEKRGFIFWILNTCIQASVESIDLLEFKLSSVNSLFAWKSPRIALRVLKADYCRIFQWNNHKFFPLLIIADTKEQSRIQKMKIVVKIETKSDEAKMKQILIFKKLTTLCIY